MTITEVYDQAEMRTMEPFLRLREPFPAEQVGKLPRSGGKVVLDYVGHGAVTSRLLEADPLWNWEPVATKEDGTPQFDEDDKGNYVGLWIRLTVAGVTRLGYGSVPSGTQDAVKQLIGDAIRNAAMRFGVALDLWIKGHVPEDDERNVPDRERATGRAPVGEASSVGVALAEAFYKSAEKEGVERKTMNGWAKELAGVESLPDVPRTHWNLLRDRYAVYLQEKKIVPPAPKVVPSDGGPASADVDGASEPSKGEGSPQGPPAGGATLGARAKAKPDAAV